ncbi:site-specific integrase [Enterovibrio norvegicus]|uniref:integrase n=1 Tax=Enterovibrio norvegicus TaxID=188144 RepID=UPI000C85A3F9|nr:integrase [Enterovibrio norvegicus]
MLAFFLGTPLSTLEINRIQLGDVIGKSGSLNHQFDIRGKADYHGDTRFYCLSNMRINTLINNYLDYRVRNKICRGNNPDQYRGLEPNDAFFISYQNRPFSLIRQGDKYRCDAINRHIKQLLRQGGVEKPSILSGKRTFAVNLHTQGCDIAHLMAMLGDRSEETTRRLVETNPVSMAAIAANAF